MLKNGMLFNHQQQLARERKQKKQPPPSADARQPITFGTSQDQDRTLKALQLLGQGKPYSNL